MALQYLIVDRFYLLGNTVQQRKGPGSNPGDDDEYGPGFAGHPSEKYYYNQILGDFFRGAAARYYDFREGSLDNFPPYYINDSELVGTDNEETQAEENFVGFVVSETQQAEFTDLHNLDSYYDSEEWADGPVWLPAGTKIRKYLGTPVLMGGSAPGRAAAHLTTWGPNAHLLTVTLDLYEPGWGAGSDYAMDSNNNWPLDGAKFTLADAPNMSNWSNYIRPGDNPGIDTALQSEQSTLYPNWPGILGRPDNPTNRLATEAGAEFRYNWTRHFYDHAHRYNAATAVLSPEITPPPLDVGKTADISAEYVYYNGEYEAFIEDEALKETHLPNVYMILEHIYADLEIPDTSETGDDEFVAAEPLSYLRDSHALNAATYLSTLGTGSSTEEYPVTYGGHFSLPTKPAQINYTPYGNEAPGTQYYFKNYYQKFISTNVDDIPPYVLDTIDLRMRHVGYSENLMRLFGTMDDPVTIERNLNKFPFHTRIHFEARDSADQIYPGNPDLHNRGPYFARRMNIVNYGGLNYDPSDDDEPPQGSVYDWLLANIIRLNIDRDSRVNYPGTAAGSVGNGKTFHGRLAKTQASTNTPSFHGDPDFLCADMTELIITSKNLTDSWPNNDGPPISEILNPLVGQTPIVGVHDRQGFIVGAPVGESMTQNTKNSVASFYSGVTHRDSHLPVLTEEKFQLFIVEFYNFINDVRRTWADTMAGQLAYSETVAFKVAKHKVDDEGNFDPENPVQSFYLPNLPDMETVENGLATSFTDIAFYDTQIKYGQKYKYIVTAYNIVVGNQYRYTDVYRWPETYPLAAWPDRLPPVLGFPATVNYPNNTSFGLKLPPQPAVHGNTQALWADYLQGNLISWQDIEIASGLAVTFGDVTPAHVADVQSHLIAAEESWLDGEAETPGFGFYLDIQERVWDSSADLFIGRPAVSVEIPIDLNAFGALWSVGVSAGDDQPRVMSADILAEQIEYSLNANDDLTYEYRVRFVENDNMSNLWGDGRFVIGTVGGIQATLAYQSVPQAAYWDVTLYTSVHVPSPGDNAFRLLSNTGPHGLNPATPYESADNGTAEFKVHDFPSVLLIEEPYCEYDPVEIRDYPPLYPDVTLVPLRGVSNKIRILLNQEEGAYSLNPDSLIIDSTDITNYNAQRSFQNRASASADSPGNPIVFKSDDHGISFEIYRTTSRPHTYQDFSGHLLTTLSPEAANAAAYDDDILPNVQYYYTFRAIDGHQGLSFPSPVYRVQLVDDHGRVYPIIETIDLVMPEGRPLITSARKYLQIGPALSQAIVNTGSYASAGWPGTAPANFNLDTAEDSIWRDNKVFKIRVTSKHTGKKLDLNINFNEAPKVNPNE